MTNPGDLPLLSRTASEWGRIATDRLDLFLSDHAVCEQQAAQAALALISQYPQDDELVERMSALAAEEVAHLRRVLAVLRARGAKLSKRRPNDYVAALRKGIDSDGEPFLEADRLLVAALIEARSCERFARVLEVVDDPAVRSLLEDLGPAEERHWRIFHALARRLLPAEAFALRWQRWLELERDLMAARGREPTVHG
jgi:tRNA-(ms[2]io[6]A)-hydroxylase